MYPLSGKAQSDLVWSGLVCCWLAIKNSVENEKNNPVF
jgi:hypothetical protein